MANPYFTNFQGPNAAPIGSPWTTPVQTTRNSLRVISGELAAAAAGAAVSQGYYNGATYTDTDVRGRIGSSAGATGNYIDLFTRINNPNSGNESAYALEVTRAAGTDTWDLYKMVAGAASLFGSFGTFELTAGNTMWARLVTTGSGSIVTNRAYVSTDNMTTWTQIGSAQNDSAANRITTAGFVGVEMNGPASAHRLGGFYVLDYVEALARIRRHSRMVSWA